MQNSPYTETEATVRLQYVWCHSQQYVWSPMKYLVGQIQFCIILWTSWWYMCVCQNMHIVFMYLSAQPYTYCVCTSIHFHVNICKHTQIRSHMCTHACIHVHVNIPRIERIEGIECIECTDTCMCMHMCIYVCMYHTVCMLPSGRAPNLENKSTTHRTHRTHVYTYVFRPK